MACYSGFAYLYDLLMHDVPYENWVSYIDQVLTKHLGEDRQSRIVLDMACGTGNITIPLAQLGYDMIGVDVSVDMLAQAQAKVDGQRILFLAQDMRDLDLYGTVDAAICACDGFNYILDAAQLGDVFKRVRMFLNDGGVFIFDMNTEYKFKQVLGSKCFVGEADGVSYEWENSFNAETGINEYHVTFAPGGDEPFEEVHYQRAYAVDMVLDLLKTAGFSTVEVFDGYSEAGLNEKSDRAVFIARP